VKVELYHSYYVPNAGCSESPIHAFRLNGLASATHYALPHMEVVVRPSYVKVKDRFDTAGAWSVWDLQAQLQRHLPDPLARLVYATLFGAPP